jgi:hypothetical protein
MPLSLLAVLAVKCYDLPFLLNADFDVSSSRETLNEKSGWNR